jgi:hypothetical protein
MISQILQSFLNALQVLEKLQRDHSNDVCQIQDVHSATLNTVDDFIKDETNKLDQVEMRDLITVQTCSLDTTHCTNLEQETSQWMIINLFDTFSHKTKNILGREWDQISRTVWVSRTFHGNTLTMALDTIPTIDLFEYYQVIGKSDNIIAARLDGYQGLSQECIAKCFWGKNTQRTLSHALHDENEEDSICDIGKILYRMKFNKEASSWLEHGTSHGTSEKALTIQNYAIKKQTCRIKWLGQI